MCCFKRSENIQKRGWTRQICDSQSAVGILQLGWENKSYKKTAMDIQQSLNILIRDGTEVKIQWSPGHANIRGNEIRVGRSKPPPVLTGGFNRLKPPWSILPKVVNSGQYSPKWSILVRVVNWKF